MWYLKLKIRCSKNESPPLKGLTGNKYFLNNILCAKTIKYFEKLSKFTGKVLTKTVVKMPNYSLKNLQCGV